MLNHKLHNTNRIGAFVILFVMMLFASNLLAQVKSAKFVVTDSKTGSLLDSVLITSEKLNALTDSKGFATLVVAKRASVLFQKNGYKPLTVNKVEYGTINKIALELLSVQFPNVTINSTVGVKDLSSASFTQIDAKELTLTPRLNDIPMVLATTPSVQYYSENGNGIGYTYLRLRGVDQRRISVFINGVPQNDPEDHSVYWIDFYDLISSLENIQVQRGAGVASYGPPAICGSVNMTTKTLSQVPFLTLETGFGSYNTKRFTISAGTGLIGDRFSAETRITRLTSDGYRDWSWTEYTKVFFGAQYLMDNQIFKLTIFGGPHEDGLAFYGLPKSYNDDETLRKSNAGARLGDREFLHQPQVHLTHSIKLNSQSSLTTTAFFIAGYGFFDFDGSWGSNDYLRLDTNYAVPSDLVIRAAVDNKQYGVVSEVKYDLNKLTLFAGIEARFHRSKHYGRIEKGSGLPTDVLGESADKHFYEYNGYKNMLSVYATGDYKLSDIVSLSGRLQLIKQNYGIENEKFIGTSFTTPYLFLNPQLGLNAKLTNELTGFISVAYTKREPPLKNLYDAESGSWGAVPQFEVNNLGQYDYDKPLVKPESLFDLELGLRTVNELFGLEVTGYMMQFENEIVPSGGLDVFGQPRVGNGEKTLHLGIELDGWYRVSNNFTLKGNLSLSRNRFVHFSEYNSLGVSVNRDDNYIANAPEIISNLSADYKIGSLSISANMNYTGKQFTNNSQKPGEEEVAEITVPDYLLMNLNLAYELPLNKSLLTFTFSVNNLFNRKAYLIGFGSDNFFPVAERNIFAGLKFTL